MRLTENSRQGTSRTICPMEDLGQGVERVLVASWGVGRLLSNCLLLARGVGFRTKRRPAGIRSGRGLSGRDSDTTPSPNATAGYRA
jgi:hypothetical protein